MRIRSWTGAEWDGVLLWSRGLKMRIAVSGYEDAAEFRCRGGQWFAENGDAVQIDIHAIAAEPHGLCAPSLGDGGGDAGSLCSDAPAWLN
ncbi:MAG: hypothetical protein ACLQU1_07585 [Bryobacteraceae bacterium]